MNMFRINAAGRRADALPETTVADPKKCLICFWEGWLSVAPSILNAAIRLSQRGCSVDIVTFEPTRQKFAALPSLPKSVKVIQLKRARDSLRLLQRALSRTPAWQWLASTLEILDFIRVVALARRKAYTLIIGIDTIGLLLSKFAGRQADATTIFWSLELDTVSTPWALIERTANSSVRQFIKQVGMIVVQDSARAAVLIRQFDLDESRIRLIPNSAMGLAATPCRTFLKERLNIDPACRIVLYAGMICDVALSAELAASTADWPEGYLLVLHEREKRDPAEPYLKRVSASGGDRVMLSLAPVPLDQVDNVYASAFIGIVIYANEYGPNFSEVALASGKLSYFLRNGIPIIVNDNPSLMEFVAKWECGLAANRLSDIPSCIAGIEKNYETYRTKALECFTEFLDFRLAFDAAFDNFFVLDEANDLRSEALPDTSAR